jgi:GT2 family glycosyltransferase
VGGIPARVLKQYNNGHWSEHTIARKASIPTPNYDNISGKTAILIVTHNNQVITDSCINSVIRNTHLPYTLTVLDNGSTIPYTNPAVEDIIRMDTNLGYLPAMNHLLSNRAQDHIVMLNNDTIVSPDWLSRLLDIYVKYPSVGLVGPISNNGTGIQVAPFYGDDFNTFSADWNKSHRGEVIPTIRLCGFCMVLNKKVLDKLGGLDKRFVIGNFDDDDYSLRATLAGFKNYIAVDSYVYHYGQVTIRALDIDPVELVKESWVVFRNKWGIPIDAPIGAYQISKSPDLYEALLP